MPCNYIYVFIDMCDYENKSYTTAHMLYAFAMNFYNMFSEDIGCFTKAELYTEFDRLNIPISLKGIEDMIQDGIIVSVSDKKYKYGFELKPGHHYVGIYKKAAEAMVRKGFTNDIVRVFCALLYIVNISKYHNNVDNIGFSLAWLGKVAFGNNNVTAKDREEYLNILKYLQSQGFIEFAYHPNGYGDKKFRTKYELTKIWIDDIAMVADYMSS